MRVHIYKLFGLALCLGSLALNVAAQSREEREADRENRRQQHSRRYHDSSRGDRMAKGFFGGATTGAIIGGLVGGGRGAGIGLGVGAATGLMAGAAASDRHRYDDYYDDYQDQDATSNERDYDHENTEYYDNPTNEMSFNNKDLGSQTVQMAMGESLIESQPTFTVERIQQQPEQKPEIETITTETDSSQEPN